MWQDREATSFNAAKLCGQYGDPATPFGIVRAWSSRLTLAKGERMTDNVVSLRGEPISRQDREPWIDAAEMLERLAVQVRAGDVKAVGVAFVELQGGLPQVVANWSFA